MSYVANASQKPVVNYFAIRQRKTAIPIADEVSYHVPYILSNDVFAVGGPLLYNVLVVIMDFFRARLQHLSLLDL